ncbi:tRNA (N(6)-L-threonylcarbamoyladenosine(37)-C(2))-methylthiotransferase MtaB [Paenibacillus sp. YN15]|uniref:tRNA (N(6)-L-threonylcarbamoyladenosine(37)-C(2))- methylthiotransferase MtaB n=1 Tax=Paenibacillus sp. YN15 TaxID=1742774 RepID=UPI000DCAF293|nr:tRNA (N(6)-L-threonylcarbamoyladenosine(37)-C(2))-methylthiotransferase MtaB [Paenibacillus sp. YN15]RAU94203.1 tRNA (N(6)-L-threonylcarbamoyladenosine(37)-C(2))-methylthiotransferase MtaB [Paenibacillus sp. YN15]
MAKVAFHTLGCKVNFYETEGIWQLFRNEGYEKADFEETADVYVINTCTVTNTGDKKSRQAIRRAIRRNPEAIIAVTGCYAQTAPAEIAAIPGVDIVIGTQDRDKIMELVHKYQAERAPINAVRNIMKTREFEELDVPEFTGHTRAFLKIQEGCNNFCTFCIIPWSRGLLRSRKPESVLAQARQLVETGYQEIVLAGIHTGGYGEDLDGYSLAMLLRDLDKVDGLKRIRISSIEASQIDREILDVLGSSSKMCRHLHIPLQAGDDAVLSAMRRKYTTAEYGRKLELIHQTMPDVAVTTDVITGFPGETAEMFESGLHFMEQMRFADMHIFPYSKRTGTPAARMDGQIPEEEKNRRVGLLMELSSRMRLDYSRRFAGEILEVIPEMGSYEGDGDVELIGHSDNYLHVAFSGPKELAGRMVQVRLTEAEIPYCRGVLLKDAVPAGFR